MSRLRRRGLSGHHAGRCGGSPYVGSEWVLGASHTRVTIDASRAIKPLERIWNSFGYDELNWTATPRAEPTCRR